MSLAEDLASALENAQPAEDRRNVLTDRQKMVLDFIHLHQVEHGCPPTLREIGRAMGIRSTNGVADHLRALERKGAISRSSWKSRSIRTLVPSESKTLEARLSGEVHAYRTMLRRLIQATDTLPTMTARLALAIGEANALLRKSS